MSRTLLLAPLFLGLFYGPVGPLAHGLAGPFIHGPAGLLFTVLLDLLFTVLLDLANAASGIDLLDDGCH